MPNVNDANKALFQDIRLYDNMSDPYSNYQHLWNLTNSTGGVDPEPNSFFNIQTLKTFCDLGDAVPNIIKNQTAVFGTDFELSEDWITLTQTLGLSDKRQTYMIWLWIDTAWDFTFERTQDGGDL